MGKLQHKRNPQTLYKITCRRIIERFSKKIGKRADSDCWAWKSKWRTKEGYGQFAIDRVCLPAHRVAYAIFTGDIPEGMTVEHKCRTPECANPDHLILLPVDRNTAHGNRHREGTSPQPPIGTHVDCGGDVYSDGFCYSCGMEVGEDGLQLPIQIGQEDDDSIPF